MPPHRRAPGTPEDWLARARGDLALAGAPLPENGFYEDLCFHAQQAAEKAIKSVYQARGLRFDYTHDLGKLLSGLAAEGLAVPEDVANADVLTSFASASRYPGLDEPVTAEEYAEAVERARVVFRWAEGLVRG